ncbi:amino acid ABC transporter substrate-binding protein, PAAT family [Pseudomonas peli]|jgi:polar amino acid transport system substrate-binding protein|uniref:Amino acid ABC transporter substrate-binding protein, PAAT family n=1 Tax=Pseudomonas peli TaxID=592361 RepID=A0AB37Z530_9PSED|nr:MULTISPECIES: transporter substrate-binding domain-containing protein [Pseudomonas]MDR7023587.1 polar amino acid transport system substrate-binding protein [Pseudomonas peli]NMY51502.1 transporter substrate-binding domain-containing protein [Pseudomonas sp. WS 5011]NMZ68415.1 transporter substrate-binding domain-containing protein [Pseudomonas peli]SCW45119.1 amino acid ABC transporter substrate-binding protein, PAAT family [Pseudomonas peli]
MRLMSLLGALLLLIGYSSLALAAKLQLYTEEYRPLSYFDDGKLTGMAVEVVEQLIQRTGASASIQVVPWTRGYHQVQREANTGLFSIVRTARRESLFQWVGPIALGHTSFYARRGAGLNVRSLKDVERFSTVAVPKQWYSYEYLSDKGLKNLYAVPTPQHMTKMFKHGRIELLVASSLALDDMLAEQGMSARDVELQFTLMGTNSYIAFSKNTDPALVQRWQQALDQLTRDGGLLRIHRRWFSDPNSMPVLAPAP